MNTSFEDLYFCTNDYYYSVNYGFNELYDIIVLYNHGKELLKQWNQFNIKHNFNRPYGKVINIKLLRQLTKIIELYNKKN